MSHSCLLGLVCAVASPGLLLAAPPASSPAAPRVGEAQAQDHAAPRSITAAEAIRLTEERWRGEIVSIELVPARAFERGDVVWSVRLLSEAGALILIRLDAETGDYLSATGVGFVDARRLPGGK
ncbi:PepSY domain-containing protein [Fulvimarina endophytica]|uniref:PepSY domain-containing protein n=1 Tax=Fulvimarina endophytica TaxID=2293836 RepID=UPI0011C01C5C|nr:PepSY domain-containing protein [Fulvimarina endophytica]